MWRYLIPNAITSASLVLGLASAWQSAQGAPELAAWMIVWGVLLDTLDGAAARLLRASSALGAQLDSFADFVVFGVAPAALVASLSGPWGMAAGAVFAVSTALRLARFNTSPADPAAFQGIPTTTCGGVAALSWLVLGGAGEAWLPAVLVGLSAAMHSPLRVARLRPQPGRPLRNAAMGACVVMAYTLGPLRLHPEALLAMVTLAISAGVLWAPAPARPV